MKSKLILILSALLIPFLWIRAEAVAVDSTLKPLIGTWNGTAVMGNETRQDLLTVNSIFDDKFLQLKLTHGEQQSGKHFEGKGIMGYESFNHQYFLYWFDNDGFYGKYEGENQNNSLVLTCTKLDGSKQTLIISFDSGAQFKIVVQEGSRTLQTITYIKQ